METWVLVLHELLAISAVSCVLPSAPYSVGVRVRVCMCMKKELMAEACADGSLVAGPFLITITTDLSVELLLESS